MLISCHFRDCKALVIMSLTQVSAWRYSKCTDLYLYRRLRPVDDMVLLSCVVGESGFVVFC